MIEREGVRTSPFAALCRQIGVYKDRAVVRVIVFKIDSLCVRETINPRLVCHISVQPFEDLMGCFPSVIPGVFSTPSRKRDKGVCNKGVPKIIHQIVKSRVSTSFLVVIEHFVEISPFKPTIT